MIASKGRLYDMGVRISILEIAASCVRLGRADNAAFFQNEADKLSDRIKKHDYEKEDEEYESVDDIERRAQKFDDINQ